MWNQDQFVVYVLVGFEFDEQNKYEKGYYGGEGCFVQSFCCQ